MVCWEYRHIGPSIQQAGAELFVWFRLYFCFLCLTSLGFEIGCFGFAFILHSLNPAIASLLHPLAHFILD